MHDKSQHKALPPASAAGSPGAQPRFEVICDPVDYWLVWDNEDDCVAMFGGEALIGLMQARLCRSPTF